MPTSSIVSVCSLMLAWLEPLVLVVYDGFLELVYVEHKAFELSAAEVYSVLCLLK